MISAEFLLTSLIVVLMPGTGVIYTVATGLFRGKKAGLFAALGCTLGILPSLIASITGLAIIFHTSALAFQGVKLAGVAYLLYLAWSTLKSDNSLAFHEKPEQKSFSRIALKGFLINILNPKLTIFFLAFLPQFIPHHAGHPAYHMLLPGITLMVMTLGVFMLYGLLANRVRHDVIHSRWVTT
ncbi:LysE family translocator [Vibrio quintilis]|uniref:Homoserine/homoserine lactone efflux protein n=1 Tax=Vibrio quintilis TaxID=1117707 RepID=A0A1M7YRM3_9VIBR|nr:LysE family translocator [Vibrio quintilis]SHO55176.1 Homoserine/homoserine lactone efflux protein [Vibrio quintilis]